MEDQTQPGRNGGTLKRGNTVNVGRKPDEIRAAFRELGAKIIQELQRRKESDFTPTELAQIGKLAAQYGVGDKVEHSGELNLKWYESVDVDKV